MISGAGGKAVVIDNGSSSCKAGFAGEAAPSVEVDTLVGRLKPTADPELHQDLPDSYIGYDAWRRRRYTPLVLRYPIKDGIITNWDDMELIWDHLFKGLRVDPSDSPVLLTEAPLNPGPNREKTMQIMFETFRTPSACLRLHALLVPYASVEGDHLDTALKSPSQFTGIVLESGDAVTYALPIVDGKPIVDALQKTDYGGKDVSDYLIQKFWESSLDMLSSRDTVKDIKETATFVALDFDEAMNTAYNSNTYEKTYDKPDAGISLPLNMERFVCPEFLFRPSLCGCDTTPGLPYLIENVINLCEKQVKGIHKDLYGNILISGGNTMFPGLPERLEKDLNSLAPSRMVVHMVAPSNRKYSAWLGGANLAAHHPSVFSPLCITSAEYDEEGPTVVHRKL
jgi:actin